MLTTLHMNDVEMNNRDWYLNQLGVMQYTLRKPTVLAGETAIQLNSQIRLIVISESTPTEKIFTDILSAINLTTTNVLFIKPEQAERLPNDIKTVLWLIDSETPDSLVQTQCPLVKTQTLAQLANSIQDKRQLWQTLCQYEHYFLTHQ